jgi:hypothetical protein
MIAVVMYCAYGDESRDGTGKRVYAVSGVFGHESDWKAIRGPWKKRLRGIVFHAADCQSGEGEFKNLSETERQGLYRDLVSIFIKSKLIAASGAIAISEYNDVFPRDKKFEHAPYLWLFGDIVLEMAQLASVSIPRQGIKVTFDRNPSIQHNASLLYDFIRRSPDQRIVRILDDEVSFATRKTMGIQVADLIARETMMRLDDELRCIRRVRGSFAALRNSKRFRFHFLRKNDFEGKKKNLADSPQGNQLSLARYDEWTRDNGIQDCQTNRLRFIDAMRAEEQKRIQ